MDEDGPLVWKFNKDTKDDRLHFHPDFDTVRGVFSAEGLCGKPIETKSRRDFELAVYMDYLQYQAEGMALPESANNPFYLDLKLIYINSHDHAFRMATAAIDKDRKKCRRTDLRESELRMPDMPDTRPQERDNLVEEVLTELENTQEPWQRNQPDIVKRQDR